MTLTPESSVADCCRWFHTHCVLTRELHDRSLKFYAGNRDTIIGVWGDRSIGSITRLDVVSSVSRIKETGVSGETVNKTVVYFRQMLRTICDLLNLADPTYRVRVPRCDVKQRASIGPEGIKRYLFAVRNPPGRKAWDDACLGLELVAVTGLRRAELAGLKCFDFEVSPRGCLMHIRRQGTLHSAKCRKVSKLKTESSIRSIWLPEPTMRVVNPRLAEGPSESLLVRCYMGKVKKLHRAIVKSEKLPSFPLHGLRHSMAMALLLMGEDIKTVSLRLGHSDISVTSRYYTHTDPDLQRRASDRISHGLYGDD